jgi:integrase
LPHFLEVDEVLKLLAKAKEHSVEAWLMCYLAFRFHMRAHEVCGGWCSWKNKKTGKKTRVHYPGITAANIVGNRFQVKRLKGSNAIDGELEEHDNPLLNVRQAMFDLCKKTPVNQKLFPVTARTFQRWIKQFGIAAGLPARACHPHTMKSSGIDYLREKMPLEELQIETGHKNLNSLKPYMNPKKSVAAQKARAAFASISV